MTRRIVIAYSNKRKPLESVLKEELDVHPNSKPKLSGTPGDWRVTRDALEDEDLATHKARDYRRGI